MISTTIKSFDIIKICTNFLNLCKVIESFQSYVNRTCSWMTMRDKLIKLIVKIEGWYIFLSKKQMKQKLCISIGYVYMKFLYTLVTEEPSSLKLTLIYDQPPALVNMHSYMQGLNMLSTEVYCLDCHGAQSKPFKFQTS